MVAASHFSLSGLHMAAAPAGTVTAPAAAEPETFDDHCQTRVYNLKTGDPVGASNIFVDEWSSGDPFGRTVE